MIWNRTCLKPPFGDFVPGNEYYFQVSSQGVRCQCQMPIEHGIGPPHKINVIAHWTEISNRHCLAGVICKHMTEFSGWKLLCLYKKHTFVFCQIWVREKAEMRDAGGANGG